MSCPAGPFQGTIGPVENWDTQGWEPCDVLFENTVLPVDIPPVLGSSCRYDYKSAGQGEFVPLVEGWRYSLHVARFVTRRTRIP